MLANPAVARLLELEREMGKDMRFEDIPTCEELITRTVDQARRIVQLDLARVVARPAIV